MRIWILLSVGLGALLLLLVSALQLRAGRAPAGQLQGAELSEPKRIESFDLVAADGEARTLTDFEEQLVIVFFGFTNCPDVCPLTMGRLANIYADLGEPDDLQVVMITVDPQRDTPEVVQSYVEGFHPDFMGLSGTPEEIAAAAESFFVGYEMDEHHGIIHTDSVAVLDRQGRMRVVYGQQSMQYLEQDLQAILARGDF